MELPCASTGFLESFESLKEIQHDNSGDISKSTATTDPSWGEMDTPFLSILVQVLNMETPLSTSIVQTQAVPAKEGVLPPTPCDILKVSSLDTGIEPTGSAEGVWMEEIYLGPEIKGEKNGLYPDNSLNGWHLKLPPETLKFGHQAGIEKETVLGTGRNAEKEAGFVPQDKMVEEMAAGKADPAFGRNPQVAQMKGGIERILHHALYEQRTPHEESGPSASFRDSGEAISAQVKEGTRETGRSHADFSFSDPTSPERVTGHHARGQESESLEKTPFRNEVLSQIVEKAVLTLRNGQEVMSIRLKPEFLGQLQVKVAAEDHRIALRIVAENPLVKDLIENNIDLLKNSLHNQGLEIDQLDVFVGSESDQNRGPYEGPSLTRIAGEIVSGGLDNSPHETEEEEIPRNARDQAIRNLVDFFV